MRVQIWVFTLVVVSGSGWFFGCGGSADKKSARKTFVKHRTIDEKSDGATWDGGGVDLKVGDEPPKEEVGPVHIDVNVPADAPRAPESSPLEESTAPSGADPNDVLLVPPTNATGAKTGHSWSKTKLNRTEKKYSRRPSRSAIMKRHAAAPRPSAARIVKAPSVAEFSPKPVVAPKAAVRSASVIPPDVVRWKDPVPKEEAAAPVFEAAAPEMAEMAEAAPVVAETPPAGNSKPSSDPSSDVAAKTDAGAEDQTQSLVHVFYGTDRARVDRVSLAPTVWSLVPTAVVLLLTLLIAGGAWRFSAPRVALASAVVGVVAAAFIVYHPVIGYIRAEERKDVGVAYGNQRGQLEVGTCEVSIPKNHQVGIVESPSILRLEVRQDKEKHVVLQKVTSWENEAFFNKLREVVQASPRREALVFVHGFNVTFENAVRRTAQIAHDLQFEGAPVCYSWPSQGGVLQYTVDETNVVWTTPHLKQFLLEIVEHSQAQSINLVAHSMGNRALTSAMGEIAREFGAEKTLFNQVVLAAPDIDAEVFRRDIVPRIVPTARRVTLYASSDDQALLASKQMHGYPRAGDSGENLVIAPGIETVDVSGIDTSLLGHSYYGSSGAILDDLRALVIGSLPAARRRLLQPVEKGGFTYWVLRHVQAAAARERSLR